MQVEDTIVQICYGIDAEPILNDIKAKYKNPVIKDFIDAPMHYKWNDGKQYFYGLPIESNTKNYLIGEGNLH